MEIRNESAARDHFIECIQLNPSHTMARTALNKPSLYREVSTDVFEALDPGRQVKVLFVVFGNDLADVINTFSVIAGLREKFSSEIVWLTSTKYGPVARFSFAARIQVGEPRGIIPWNWISSEGFTHVFYPECDANQEEWEQGGLHRIDFMASKCGVRLETRQTWLEPGPEAVSQAEEFLQQHRLTRKGYLTASHVGASSRHWPHSNLMKLTYEIRMPTIIFGEKTDPEISGIISCFGKTFEVMAALIRWSCFYVGPASGISWIATTTDTPMGVFLDPVRPDANTGVQKILEGEKENIEEWSIYTSPETVIQHVQSAILVEEPQRESW